MKCAFKLVAPVQPDRPMAINSKGAPTTQLRKGIRNPREKISQLTFVVWLSKTPHEQNLFGRVTSVVPNSITSPFPSGSYLVRSL